jgi:hypothetical protein
MQNWSEDKKKIFDLIKKDAFFKADFGGVIKWNRIQK